MTRGGLAGLLSRWSWVRVPPGAHHSRFPAGEARASASVRDSRRRAPFPPAGVRIYFAAPRWARLRRRGAGDLAAPKKGGETASGAWREPAVFSIIEGLPKGSGEAQAVDSARALDDGGRSSVGRAPGCDPGRRGFESHRPPHLPGRTVSGPLAQLVEQETLNLLVVGSTPTRPTN